MTNNIRLADEVSKLPLKGHVAFIVHGRLVHTGPVLWHGVAEMSGPISSIST